MYILVTQQFLSLVRASYCICVYKITLASFLFSSSTLICIENLSVYLHIYFTCNAQTDTIERYHLRQNIVPNHRKVCYYILPLLLLIATVTTSSRSISEKRRKKTQQNSREEKYEESRKSNNLHCICFTLVCFEIEAIAR